MLKNFQPFKDMKEIAELQSVLDNANSNLYEPNISVEKWYELQHKLREEQMAQARAMK
ncbi:MAG: hypothetical protein K2O86_03030 [Clostridia bacterium]|nr:hypothetical protein [Clostridia bacterium]